MTANGVQRLRMSPLGSAPFSRRILGSKNDQNLFRLFYSYQIIILVKNVRYIMIGQLPCTVPVPIYHSHE